MICLIIPPSPFLLDERVFMSLGVLKVAASLEAAGVAVEVLDLSGVRDFESVVADYMRRSPPEWFGITATSPQLPAAVKIAAVINAADTIVPRRRCRVILGGQQRGHSAQRLGAEILHPAGRRHGGHLVDVQVERAQSLRCVQGILAQ